MTQIKLQNPQSILSNKVAFQFFNRVFVMFSQNLL